MKGNQGPWARLSRKLIDTYVTDDNNELLMSFGIIWDRSRARDHFNIGSILYVLHKFPTLSNVPSGQTISKFLQGIGTGKTSKIPPPNEQFITMVSQALEIFFILAGDKKYNWAFTTAYQYRGDGASDDDDDVNHKNRSASQKKTRTSTKAKIAPIEFVMINVLIAQHKSFLSFKQLSSSINYMRKQLREEHVDIRANGRVAKFCLDIIDRLNPDMFPDNTGSPPAERQLETANKKKRKRNEKAIISDDDDESVTNGQRGMEEDGKATKQTKFSAAKDVKGKTRQDEAQRVPEERPYTPTGPQSDLNRARSTSSATLAAPLRNMSVSAPGSYTRNTDSVDHIKSQQQSPMLSGPSFPHYVQQSSQQQQSQGLPMQRTLNQPQSTQPQQFRSSYPHNSSNASSTPVSQVQPHSPHQFQYYNSNNNAQYHQQYPPSRPSDHYQRNHGPPVTGANSIRFDRLASVRAANAHRGTYGSNNG